MPAPIIFWSPSNIPIEIQSELERRRVNRSFSFVSNQTANWDKNTGDWNTYRGPMVSWVRVCSNGYGPRHKDTTKDKPRFVLYGGKGFYETYGFSKPVSTNPRQQVVGYTPEGQQHVIENTLLTPGNDNFPIHVGTPEISRIEVIVQKELFRRATIEWVCFSWKQLEYLTPYFLVPGNVTVMVEWGWNHFNPSSLVPLYDVSTMKELWNNSYPLYTENILRSKGNYDVVYGIVSNFNWSIEGTRIICSTEITSKDRLYAGISPNSALTVRDDNAKKNDEPAGIFQSLKEFVAKDDTAKIIRSLANSKEPLAEITKLGTHNPHYLIWRDIIHSLIYGGNVEMISRRLAYVHGVFSGRPKEFYSDFGTPQPGDFDVSVEDKDTTKLWINMGLIVEILNHFSKLPGGGGKPMFTVDIMNSVIGGHPNMISCDPRVLIPNYQAPKYHYGAQGFNKFKSDKGLSVESPGYSDYADQFVVPISLSQSGSLSNTVLGKTFYQTSMAGGNSANKFCFRSDLDSVINMLRNKYAPKDPTTLGSWSFPASTNSQLGNSFYGLPGNFVEKDFSGLLSNIYISYDAFKTAVQGASSTGKEPEKFTEVYTNLLQLLMDASDGFWDLALVEAENTLTIADRKYVGNQKINGSDPMMVFDYYDADSIIKSIKFKPVLSDAVATRTMFGGVNNQGAKYFFTDKDDLIDYVFKDAINFDDKERIQGDSKSDLEKMKTAKQQIKDLVTSVQQINYNDGSLQMTFTGPSTVYSKIPVGKKEIVKLTLSQPGAGKQLLRMLLDDKDDENNNRYCAVQPNIVLELVLSGIGGIRTFQYFLVKNLPRPYDHKNIIFRVTDVQHTIESGNWETTIRARPLPLRPYIKRRVNGPGPNGTWPEDNKS